MLETTLILPNREKCRIGQFCSFYLKDLASSSFPIFCQLFIEDEGGEIFRIYEKDNHWVVASVSGERNLGNTISGIIETGKRFSLTPDYSINSVSEIIAIGPFKKVEDLGFSELTKLIRQWYEYQKGRSIRGN